MTTTQQPGYGRHARPDEPERAAVAPSVAPVPVQRIVRDDASRPLSVGEYVQSMQDTAQDTTTVRDEAEREPGFGEWPYGGRRQEPAGPNPYLPSEGAAADVALPPGGWPGTAAFLIGMVGVALAMAPITAVVVWPLTILGVILGVVGVRRVRRGTARNGVAAVVGTVFCVAALGVCAAWIALYTMAGLTTAPPAQAGTPTSQVR